MLRHLFALLSISVLLTGCGAMQTASDAASDAYEAIFTKKKKNVKIEIAADNTINPTRDGKPLSVTLRFYQLKDDKPFLHALYRDLLDNDKAVLSNNALSADTLTITPNITTSMTMPLSQDTQYLGVVAFFRETDQGEWRLVIDRKALIEQRQIRVRISGNSLAPDRR